MSNAIIFQHIKLDATDKWDLFQQVSTYLLDKQIITEKKDFIDELKRREQIGSTVLEEGLALPHVSHAVVNQHRILLVHLNQPISKWDGENDVDTCLFLLFNPAITEEESQQVRNIMVKLAYPENVLAFRSRDSEDYQSLIN